METLFRSIFRLNRSKSLKPARPRPQEMAATSVGFIRYSPALVAGLLLMFGFAGAITEKSAHGVSSYGNNTVIITRSTTQVSGVMRLNGTDIPLTNVSESNGFISFSASFAVALGSRAEPRANPRSAPAPAPIEQRTPVAAPELLPPIPEVAVTRAASLRLELLPPIPQVTVTRAVPLRPELLASLPQVAVTREVSQVAVTREVSLPPALQSPIPEVAVTGAAPLRPELLPPIPDIAVTPSVSLRPTLQPPMPQVAATGPVSGALDQEADFRPEDKAVIRDYVLTVPKFNAFIDGVTALAAAKTTDDSLARELNVIDRYPAGTLADLQTQLTAHPRAFKFYQRQGLTADDAVLIPLVAGYASAAIEGNNFTLFADRISRAQINFMRANSALRARLMTAYLALSVGR